jgi:predicted NUDIX family NTP pyrophosphohydrolase
MPKARRSAGILLYRRSHGRIEVLLGHPGGPFWTRRDEGAWGIPKGEIGEAEDPLQAARREFLEETGLALDGPFTPLQPIRQPSGKTIYAWAAEGDCDAGTLTSIAFSMEWPPRSGRSAEFPEIDRAAWFALDEARRKVLRGQSGFLDQLESLLAQ